MTLGLVCVGLMVIGALLGANYGPNESPLLQVDMSEGALVGILTGLLTGVFAGSWVFWVTHCYLTFGRIKREALAVISQTRTNIVNTSWPTNRYLSAVMMKERLIDTDPRYIAETGKMQLWAAAESFRDEMVSSKAYNELNQIANTLTGMEGRQEPIKWLTELNDAFKEVIEIRPPHYEIWIVVPLWKTLWRKIKAFDA